MIVCVYTERSEDVRVPAISLDLSLGGENLLRRHSTLRGFERHLPLDPVFPSSPQRVF